MYLSKENNLCLNLHHVAHSFPVRIGLGFEKNTYCSLGVSRWRLALLAPNSPSGLIKKTHISL
jgi:hypothetical protein